MIGSASGVTVLLGLGSNLGDPVARIRGAVAALAERLADVKVSAVYRTRPEGGADQPEYANAALRGRSSESPFDILRWVQRMEADAGRSRPYRGAPRTLDIDVLFVGDTVLQTPELSLPHPRWSRRDFVVVPLLDIAADWIDPVSGLSVREVAKIHGHGVGALPLLLEAEALLPAAR